MEKVIITGYIETGIKNRTKTQYQELGRMILESGLPVQAFYPRLQDCWLWYHAQGCKVPEHSNPYKDTLEYFVAINEKVELVEKIDADVAIWLDYGLAHIGVTKEQIRDFYNKIPTKLTTIQVAGIWQQNPRCLEKPNWFCAGGVFIVPRELASWFAKMCRLEMLALLDKTNCVTWEVNLWSLVMFKYPEKFTRWLCDHNPTILTAFKE